MSQHPVMMNREKAIHALQKVMPDNSLYNDFYFLNSLPSERLIQIYNNYMKGKP